MADYIVTGGTGFLGRNVIPRLLARDSTAQIHVLVRSASADRLADLAADWNGGERVHPLVGDLTEPGLGLTDQPPRADHVVHLGAIYDLTVGDEQAATNIDGTRAVIDLARKLDAVLHHTSSIAVSGDYKGTFSESDFDLGQGFPTPYHRTKFDAEQLVRAADELRWRIYRPAAVVGDSATGAMTKIDGPYYFFPLYRALGKLGTGVPMPVPDLGATNIVPVDYVADAMVELISQPGHDFRVFHLVNPEPQPLAEIHSALSAAAGGSNRVVPLPGGIAAPFVKSDLFGTVVGRLGVPPALLDTLTMPTVFTAEETTKALAEKGISPPEFGSYAGNLWDHWVRELDPNRVRRAHRGGSLTNSHVLITGASSGIGRAAALAVAGKGATVFLLARRAEELDAVVADIRDRGGQAFGFPCDLTDSDSVDQTLASILDRHDHIDMLVNNAGRSIRRSVYRSTDRLHDFERTMAVNYFGAVRMTLGLLPQMRERKFGHIVNISSAGVQFSTPRFSAYLASKAALDKFTDVVAAETHADGITFTTIHMPLVHTSMIAPTGNKNVGQVESPEWAAATIVRALQERPKRIDVPLGTITEYWALLTPRLKDRALHRYYRAFPDSPAAKGQASRAAEPADSSPVTAAPNRTPSAAGRIAGRTVRRIARRVPGTQW